MDRVKIAPGAIIDAQTDPSSDHQVDAKILEAQFSYNERIENALNRDKNDMYCPCRMCPLNSSRASRHPARQ